MNRGLELITPYPSKSEPRIKFLFTPKTSAPKLPEPKILIDRETSISIFKDALSTPIKSFISEVSFTSEIYKEEYRKELEIYFHLLQIIEKDVSELLNKDLRFNAPLSLFVIEIEKYFENSNKDYKIGVILQEDPEDPEFKAFVIVVNTKFNNLIEKLQAEDKIGEILDSLTNRIVKSKGKEIQEVLSSITYLIEEM